MRISKIDQLVYRKVDNLDTLDAVICCCGYEERCTSLLQYYGTTIQGIKNKHAFYFTSPGSQILDLHIKEFMDFGFELCAITGQETAKDRENAFIHLFNSLDTKEKVNILIDYSSMNREWYGALILLVEKWHPKICKDLVCYFYYCIPEYNGQKDKRFSISEIKPLAGFSNISLPSMPMSLAIGLGSEEKVLLGLQQFTDVDPNYVHYYYTNNQHIFDESNKYGQLMRSIDSEHAHEYSLENMVPVFNSLCDLYRSTKDESRMTIISCGPKPFTLLSMFFARLYNVDVWKVYTNLNDHYVEKKPTKHCITIAMQYKE